MKNNSRGRKETRRLFLCSLVLRAVTLQFVSLHLSVSKAFFFLPYPSNCISQSCSSPSLNENRFLLHNDHLSSLVFVPFSSFNCYCAIDIRVLSNDVYRLRPFPRLLGGSEQKRAHNTKQSDEFWFHFGRRREPALPGMELTQDKKMPPPFFSH